MLTLGVSALIISAGVWVDPALFSFVIADVLAAGWREQHRFSLRVGVVALGGFLAKCVFEIITGNTISVEAGDTFAPVPLAPLLGGAVGAAVVMGRSIRHRAIEQTLQLRGADRLQ